MTSPFTPQPTCKRGGGGGWGQGAVQARGRVELRGMAGGNDITLQAPVYLELKQGWAGRGRLQARNKSRVPFRVLHAILAPI